jgi:phage repressor protein C with HTH and peptisase S24 domain
MNRRSEPNWQGQTPPTVGERIRAVRLERGISQAMLGYLVGVRQQSIDQLERGRAQGTRYMVAIAKALRVNPTWLADGTGLRETAADGFAEGEPRLPDNPPIADVLPQARPAAYGARNLPIYGAGQGGAEGFINADTSAAVDWTYTPPELSGVKGAFGLYVDGDSMTDMGLPEGTLVHVHPHRRPKPGQFCVAVKTGGGTFVKKYVATRAGRLVLAQSNPKREFEIALGDLRALYLITSAVWA